MISITKDLNGKYRCQVCNKLVTLHEKFNFVCNCNRKEVENYEMSKLISKNGKVCLFSIESKAN